MIPAQYYHPIYIYLVITLTLAVCVNISTKSFRKITGRVENSKITILLGISLAIFLGMRPIDGEKFADTANYAEFYAMYKYGLWVASREGEYIFTNLMELCSKVIDVSFFFTLIDILYFGFTFLSCRRLFPNNVLAGFLFNLGSFSFYSYSVNGIRNGLACSIILLFLTYIAGKKQDRIKALILAFIAFNIHHSTMLPIGMAYISLYFIKSFKTACSFWLISIFFSLVAGAAFTSMFASLGFDERLSYLTEKADIGKFSHTGFRFDFLLYSMMPIVLGYYIVIKRGITDRIYLLLLNTYTLSNAFWVMVIRASYSNRFAYLSWFLYPMVLAYPLFRINIWGDKQGSILSKIMFAQVFFTWFMTFL